jgi:hypothetical protein
MPIYILYNAYIKVPESKVCGKQANTLKTMRLCNIVKLAGYDLAKYEEP